MKISGGTVLTLLSLLSGVAVVCITPTAKLAGATEVLAQTSTKQKAQADQLLKQGIENLKSRQLKTAVQYWQQALKIYQEIGDRQGEGECLSLLGFAYNAVGQNEKAVEFLQQSLVISREIGNRRMEVNSLKLLGDGYDNLKQYQQSIKAHQQLLAIARETSDRSGEANFLNRLGVAYKNLKEYEKAVEFYQQSIVIAAEIGDGESIAGSLGNLGNAYKFLGEYEKAIKAYQQSVAVFRKIGDRQGEAKSLNHLGDTYLSFGESEKAIAAIEQSVTVFRKIGDPQGTAKSLSDLGDAYMSLGRYEKAIEVHQQSLAIGKKIEDSQRIGKSLNSLGIAYYRLGEYQKSIDFHQQSLAIKKEIGDRDGEAQSLNNLALVYHILGEDQKAIDFHQQSLAIKKEIGDRDGEAQSLGNLGLMYNSLEQYQKAIDFHQKSLAIHQEIGARQGQARTLHNLGLAYYSLGDYRKVIDFNQQSLVIKRELGDRWGEVASLGNLGSAYNSLGEYEKATDSYQQSLSIAQDIGARGWQARALSNLASVKRTQGKLNEALTDIESAINILEQLRTNIISQDLRTSYFATVQDYYQQYIDLLMQLHKQNPNQGYDAKALHASERSRARSLLDILAESGADIKTGVDPQLLAQEKKLLQQLNTLDQARQLNTSGYNPNELKQKIESLRNQLQQLEVKIKQNSPRYANLKYPDPLTVTKIQQQVIDKDTILLQYSLGATRSYLWLVTTTEISSYELPKRTEIEELAKQFREEIISLSPVPETGNKLTKILLSPVANKLENKRLLIVGDGILQTIPFAALPLPQNLNKTNYQPLIVNHEIVTLPSASSIAILREQVKGRTPAPKKVAVFADPVFADNDPRFQTISQTNTETETNDLTRIALTRSLDDFLSSSFNRLSGTRQEAEAILALVPDNLEQLSLDFDANRQTAINPNLGEYQIVHFATHGLLNETQPELSGLVLSLYNETGKETPGFLQLNDIFNLEMPAELVVLSACETGVGEEIRGEGLVSLTRGFMYAGAKRVVVSLWSVEDNSTAELMENYYQKMLETDKNPVEAMRETQLEMLSSENWKAPYYWAPFVVQGEWR
ncbi:CHAT domain-containing tetratricopeptide repeat protein [Okeania sp. SIO1I7]|uniref:CHAT domain-containing tetratricopeptide repeat protein n=1 Tax=Okeania sp. SIO1I7 TaxID=2607772 RepID=UPI0013FAED2D|nr:CHAT domain-containing tetratricopeptide repeat protein [Okeania sp. SIO1I7]NET24581.1 CHAT domain-containing protein [Okeania sp. SIO1I7]